MKFQMNKDGLTGDTLKFAEAMDSAIAKALETAVDAQTLEAKITAAVEGKGLTADQLKQINETAETVRKHAAELDKIKAGGIDVPVESFQKTLENSVDELKKIHSNRTGMKQFNLKAAAVTTTATTGTTRAITNSVDATGAQRLGDGPMNLINRAQPFILDYVNVGSTNASTLVWWDEKPKEGDFAVTAEGVVK